MTGRRGKSLFGGVVLVHTHTQAKHGRRGAPEAPPLAEDLIIG